MGANLFSEKVAAISEQSHKTDNSQSHNSYILLQKVLNEPVPKYVSNQPGGSFHSLHYSAIFVTSEYVWFGEQVWVGSELCGSPARMLIFQCIYNEMPPAWKNSF